MFAGGHESVFVAQVEQRREHERHELIALGGGIPPCHYMEFWSGPRNCLLQSISVHCAFGGIMSEKPSAILPGTVEKIIKSPFPSEPEKAQITVEGGDHLYREIRIDNTLTNEQGEEVSLKPGAHVEVTVAAEADATTPKSGDNTHTTSASATRP